MSLGSLVVELSANLARFESDMGRAARIAERHMADIDRFMGKAALIFEGVAAGGLAYYIKSIIDAADQMNDLSQKVGINIDMLAKYQLATAQSGTSMESLAKGVKGIATNLAEHGDAMRQAGITATTADGAMRQIAELFSQMPDGIEKTALAVKLFGKSGMEMIPMLNMGAKGLDEAAEKSAKYAAVMADLGPRADQFNDTLAELGMASKVAGLSIINDMLPPMTDIAKAMAAASHESGGLMAAWVGLGGIGKTVLYPLGALFAGMLANLQEMNAEMLKFFGANEASLQAYQSAGRMWKQIASLDTEAGKLEPPKPFDTNAWMAKYKQMMSALGVGSGSGDKGEAEKKALAEYLRKQKLRDDDVEAWRKALSEIDKMQVDQVNKQEADTKALYEKGLNDYAAYIDTMQDRAVANGQLMLKLQKQTTNEMTEFWKQAARSMQSSMSDFFFNAMQGKLTNLGEAFKLSIYRMLADVAAAKAATAMFGADFGKGGDMGGWAGMAMAGIKGYFGSSAEATAPALEFYAEGTRYVPRTGPAILHEGERVLTASENARGSGASIVFSPQINIDSRTDSATIGRMVDGAMRVSEARLIDQLNRSQGGISQAVRRAA